MSTIIFDNMFRGPPGGISERVISDTTSYTGQKSLKELLGLGKVSPIFDTHWSAEYPW